MTRPLNRTRLAHAAAALALSLPAAVMAQTPMPGTAPVPGAAAIQGPTASLDVVTLSGEVTAIDRAARTVAVRGDDGAVATLTVGPNVNNFDRLQPGDRVTLRYSEAVSLALAKGSGDTDAQLGEIRTKVEADSSRQVAPGAGKPGLAVTDRTTVVANVFEIDRERGLLTLRGTDGVPVDIKVEDRQALAQFDVNDQIVIAYREAAVVSIQPGKPNVDPGTGVSGTPAPSASPSR